MKFYVAGSMHERTRLAEFADHIRHAGHEVEARWLTLPEPFPEPLACASMDLDDLEACEAIVCVRPQNSSRGGCWLELGYAYAKRRGIILIGPPHADQGTVFLSLFNHQFPDEEAFLNWLYDIKKMDANNSPGTVVQ